MSECGLRSFDNNWFRSRIGFDTLRGPNGCCRDESPKTHTRTCVGRAGPTCRRSCRRKHRFAPWPSFRTSSPSTSGACGSTSRFSSTPPTHGCPWPVCRAESPASRTGIGRPVNSESPPHCKTRDPAAKAGIVRLRCVRATRSRCFTTSSIDSPFCTGVRAMVKRCPCGLRNKSHRHENGLCRSWVGGKDGAPGSCKEQAVTPILGPCGR